ncbi:MAG TPA: hypothetical protein DDZ89_16555 [Clostridiales bacterium]|nr:hypothetical protein [Clostridiales bacterium]
MKIYITGSVGSGKSTLARVISEQSGIPYFGLDEVVHKKDHSKLIGNNKRTDQERDELFKGILALPTYIIEDTGRACFEDGLNQADLIVLLDIPLCIRKYRIILRFIKQKLGIEQCAYRPSVYMLKNMFRWAKNYDTGSDGVRNRVMNYRDKTVILKTNQDIKHFLSTLPDHFSI